MTKGTGGKLTHEPDVFGERGDLMGGYYYAVLTSGAEKYDAMPKSRIEEIKSRSEAVKKGKQSPWDTDFEEMARKTIVNWAFKFLPKTGVNHKVKSRMILTKKILHTPKRSNNKQLIEV